MDVIPEHVLPHFFLLCCARLQLTHKSTGGDVNTNTTEELLRLKDNAARRTNGSELAISKLKVEVIKFPAIYRLNSSNNIPTEMGREMDLDIIR